MKKIINAVWIDKDIDDVFWITNQIDDWYLLFSEYETSKVLVRNGNWMRFRLKTKQEDGHPSAEWISERTLYPKDYSKRNDRPYADGTGGRVTNGC